MRERYDEITGKGAEVVAVGTGDARYAQAFIDDEHIPFPVLVDDGGEAAAAASLRRSAMAAMSPRSVIGGLRAARRGRRQQRTGARPLQMGATFVIGPGPTVHYQHVDRDPADHAPFDEVLAALPNA